MNKPEALRLADALMETHPYPLDIKQAAAELRRLHVENAALAAAPPQRKPLTEEGIMDAVRESDLDWQAGWTLDEHEPNRFATLVRAVEQAHGIKE